MDLFIFRKPCRYFKNDMLMTMAQILYIIVIYTSTALFFIPMRNMLMCNLGLDRRNLRYNFLICVMMVLLTSFVSTLFTDISEFINFVGGLTTSIFTFTFPGLLVLKLKIYRNAVVRYLVFLLFILVSLLGLTSGFLSLLVLCNIIDPY